MQGLASAAALLLFLSGLAGAAPAAAAIAPDEILKDPKLEARARAIGQQLRCLVCQNQSIDDSDAPLAKDLRRLVRERLRKGETDAQIISYIHERYGDFVLLRPPVRPGTWLLWYGPAGLLVIALAVIGWRLARRRDPDLPLSALERERVDQLLAGSGDVDATPAGHDRTSHARPGPGDA